MKQSSIPGYAFGSRGLARSPVTLDDLRVMRAALTFTDDDVRALRASRSILADQADAIVDVWYGFMSAQPALIAPFTNKSDGKPNLEYLDAVRRRFCQWILDTAEANFDQAWLDWQHEIALRHHREKKNKTDGVEAPEVVPYRYLPLLVYPVTATLKPFLASKGHPRDDVERMHQAWIKAVLLQVTLWSYPYIHDGDF